jgi:threonine dehydrogenase-like Zn-dependent dehydrogenase
MDPDFHRKEMTLFGSRNATSQDFEQVMAAIRGGKVPTGQLITHRTTLADAVANIPVWATSKSGLIKALVEIDD